MRWIDTESDVEEDDGTDVDVSEPFSPKQPIQPIQIQYDGDIDLYMRPNGYGKADYGIHGVYDGVWKAGLWHGPGTLTKNKPTHQTVWGGDWQWSELTTTNGSIQVKRDLKSDFLYTGRLDIGKPNGQGKYRAVFWGEEGNVGRFEWGTGTFQGSRKTEDHPYYPIAHGQAERRTVDWHTGVPRSAWEKGTFRNGSLYDGISITGEGRIQRFVQGRCAQNIFQPSRVGGNPQNGIHHYGKKVEYRGVRFRSKLEAHWAHFFDTFGIDWLYEPETFQLQGGRYTPDFYLPSGFLNMRDQFHPRKDFDPIYMEIKFAAPTHAMSARAFAMVRKTQKKMVILSGYPSPPYLSERFPGATAILFVPGPRSRSSPRNPPRGTHASNASKSVFS